MCGYCGCDSIEVIGRFMAEHVEIINANGELRAAVHSGEADTLEAAKSAVAGLLWPHTAAEEAGLFRVMAADPVYATHIAALCAEHVSLATHLAAITLGDGPAMERFENELRDHIDKEDNGIFPAAAIALDGPQWAEVHRVTPHAHGAEAGRDAAAPPTLRPEVDMVKIEIEAQGGGEYRATIGTEEATTVGLSLGEAAVISQGRLPADEATARATVAFLLGHQEAADLPPALDFDDVVAAYPDAVERIAALRA